MNNLSNKNIQTYIEEMNSGIASFGPRAAEVLADRPDKINVRNKNGKVEYYRLREQTLEDLQELLYLDEYWEFFRYKLYTNERDKICKVVLAAFEKHDIWQEMFGGDIVD